MSQGQRDPKWTPEQDAELKQQLDDCASFSVAAAAINEKFGTSYSRNAAIGRANRLGLCKAAFVRNKETQVRTPNPNVRRRVTRVIRANGNSDKMRLIECPETDLPPITCVEVEPLNLSLLDLPHNGCRYPYGDGPFTFCGHPQVASSSYCGPHWAITYSRPRGSDPAAAESRRRNLHRLRSSRILEAFA